MQKVVRFCGRCRPGLESLTIGLLLGWIDTNSADNQGVLFPAYFIVAVVLGLRHAGRAFPCWLLLGTTLYAAHVVAIACGGKPPYVEENFRFAEHCLWVIIPSGLGIMTGAGFRAMLAYFGSFRRKSDPPVRFLPRTTREIVFAVAYLGIGLGGLKRMLFPPTIYASGYDEARFRSIRIGMTSDQVRTALGEPLEKSGADDSELWKYSDQYTYTSNFERRWIFLSGGSVQIVVNDYWYD